MCFIAAIAWTFCIIGINKIEDYFLKKRINKIVENFEIEFNKYKESNESQILCNKLMGDIIEYKYSFNYFLNKYKDEERYYFIKEIEEVLQRKGYSYNDGIIHHGIILIYV